MTEPKEIETNRCKAILASNFWSLFQFAVICLSKVACNDKGVNAFDIVLWDSTFSIVLAAILILAFKGD